MSRKEDYYKKTFRKQVRACRLLKNLYKQYNFIYPETPSEDRYRPFDCIIEYKDKSASIKLEIEVAEESNYWREELPIKTQWKRRGCSIPDRKCNNGIRFDIYIKFNSGEAKDRFGLNSFFAVTDDYIALVGVCDNNLPNSTEEIFNCNSFVCIRPDKVKNDGIDMAYDDFDTALPNLIESQLILNRNKI